MTRGFVLALLALGAAGAISWPASAQSQSPQAPQATPSAPGQPTPGVTTRRPAQTTGAGRIRGRVVAADTGTPLRRASVSIYNEAIRNRSAFTDGNGVYEITDLPAGRFTLSASKTGYTQMVFGQRRPSDPARPITLNDGEHVDRIDFALSKGGVITGRLVDEFGEPLERASVRVMRAQNGQDQRRMMGSNFASTNDLGQFRVYGLSPGEYVVAASVQTPPGSDSEPATGYAPSYYPGTANLADAQRVVVEAGQEAANIDFVLTLTRMARVLGTAHDSRGRPLINAFIQLADLGNSISSGNVAQVRPDGSFVISNVAPGEYVISARTNMLPGQEGEFASVPVTVGGADISGIALVTGRGATARGQIVFEGGRSQLSPTSVQIMFVPFTTERMMAPMFFPTRPRVEDDWTFSASGVFGSMRLSVTAPGWYLKSIEMGGRDATDEPLEFKNGEEISGIRVVLTQRRTDLSGLVTDGRGQIVSDYTVIAFARDAEKWKPASRYVQTGRADQQGRYRIQGLPPGEYFAAAVESIEPGVWRDASFLERLRGGATSFSLAENATLALDLRLTQPR